jgi:hypothetical protein
MNIIPLYRVSSLILVGLDIDFPTETVEDSLVVKIDIKNKKIEYQPWSGQKMLKFGSYDVIPVSERKSLTDQINAALGKNMIIEIIDMLLHPNEESINSLVWIPERLRNKNKH